jgi:hemoglobin
MRHAPCAVDQRVQDGWMLCMTQASTEQVAEVSLRDSLLHKFTAMAHHMVNTDAVAHGCSHAAQSA